MISVKINVKKGVTIRKKNAKKMYLLNNTQISDFMLTMSKFVFFIYVWRIMRTRCIKNCIRTGECMKNINILAEI